MPELIEVEQYRSCLDSLCGSTVVSVDVPDARFQRDQADLSCLVGARLTATDRHGKLLIASFTSSTELKTVDVGLRFGMTGRLLVDGEGPIDVLEYESKRDDVAWDRLRLKFDSAAVVIRDQRMLGSVELSPNLASLGPEASTVSAEQVAAITSSRSPLKTVLLNQAKIAGLGNLLVDEVLWRAGIDPRRSANALTAPLHGELATTIRATVDLLSRRGGSHRGDTFDLRCQGAVCSRCGTLMRFGRIAGRGTWWCPGHQT